MKSEFKAIIVGFALMIFGGFHMSFGGGFTLLPYSLFCFYGGFGLIILALLLCPKDKDKK